MESVDEIPGDSEIIAEPDEEYYVISSILNGLAVLQENAWYLVIMALIAYYFWQKKLSASFSNWQKMRDEQRDSAEMKKDPEKNIHLEQARVASINKLQERYNQDAVEYNKKLKKKEEMKLQEKLSKQDVDMGRKLNEDYNPLIGTGGSGYRASRRSGCSGGSCNNR